MSVLVKQEIIVTIGETSSSISKEEAYKLYNELREILGITNNMLPWFPYEYSDGKWTSASTLSKDELEKITVNRG